MFESEDDKFVNLRITINIELPKNLVKWVRKFFDETMPTWQRSNPSYRKINVSYDELELK